MAGPRFPVPYFVRVSILKTGEFRFFGELELTYSDNCDFRDSHDLV